MEIISRAEARERGLKRFFVGEICSRGHAEERYVSNGSCLACHRMRSAKWRSGNAEKVAKQNSSYHQRHKANINKKKCRKWAERVASDPLFAEMQRIRGLIRASISNRGYSKKTKTAAILGCTWDEFRSHIEKQFLPGMTWQNRSLWHIDHIVPMATALSEQDATALNHYTNLRPIWAQDNLKKNSKELFLI